MKTLHKAEPAVAQILAAESLNNHTYKAGWKHLHPKPIIFCSCRQPYFTNTQQSVVLLLLYGFHLLMVQQTNNLYCLSLFVFKIILV